MSDRPTEPTTEKPRIEPADIMPMAERRAAEERAQLESEIALLFERAREAERVMTATPDDVAAVRRAVNYLCDAEYDMTGDSETFGDLSEQVGITDADFEAHFQERKSIAVIRG